MGRAPFTVCQRCGAALGKQNRSGHCRLCAMRDAGRRRREENMQYAKMVEACRRACPEAIARFRVFLDEWQRERERLLHLEEASLLGWKLAADLTPPLPTSVVDRLWQREQWRCRPPDATFEVQKERTYVYYQSGLDQEISAKDVQQRFEAALRREYPDISITWAWCR